MTTAGPVQCAICRHPTFPKGGRHERWTYRCHEGCQCTPTYCRPTDLPVKQNSKESTSMSTPQNADDFLMGGGGAPSAKFESFGVTVTGRITERPEVQQQRDIKSGEKKFWNDGNPMMQLVVTVQTDQRDPSINDDDGRRRLFVKGQMKQAIQEAVKAAGARGLEVGGHLTVTYTHDGVASQRGFSAPKQYQAQYTAAATAELHKPDPAAAYSVPGPAPVPQQQPPVVPGLTPQQVAAAQADPTQAALLAQLQAQQGAPAPTATPPF